MPFWPNISKYPQSPNFTSGGPGPKVLIAPLDWGLGHVTRCIPIIRALLSRNCEIWVGCDAIARQILEREIEGLHFLNLKGYGVRYPAGNRSFPLKMLIQAPKILLAIRRERKWLQGIMSRYGIDALISDNRYGLHSKQIPTVFITHQLAIISGLGHWLDKRIQAINFSYIMKFQRCWIPDFPGEHNLSGNLAHSGPLPPNAEFIGLLSRFQRTNLKNPEYEIMVILSGPEPQRTLFEKILIQNLPKSNRKICFVRGLPLTEVPISGPDHISYFNYLDSVQLNQFLQKSEWVICRAGYSSVMDLITLEKKAILVPTPGQTEQEYLATYLKAKGIFYSVTQEEFNLENCLEKASGFPYRFSLINDQPHALAPAIDKFLASLSARLEKSPESS